MAHSISQKRAEFLEENFFELSFQDQVPDRALFDSITDPAELHYLADGYNWDDGPELLEWIVSSPLCDQGTAALIFWRAQPDDYTEYASDEEMSCPDGVVSLLQHIIANWERGLYTQRNISYNRNEDPSAGEVYHSTTRKWSIPAFLLEPTPGQPFPNA